MTKNIPLKTSLDVLRIKKPSMIASGLLKELSSLIKPGITTADIDRFSIEYIRRHKADSALRGYKGFPGNVCISVNNVAAHGIGGGGIFLMTGIFLQLIQLFRMTDGTVMQHGHMLQENPLPMPAG